jgi:hypothetical protein
VSSDGDDAVPQFVAAKLASYSRSSIAWASRSRLM